MWFVSEQEVKALILEHNVIAAQSTTEITVALVGLQETLSIPRGKFLSNLAKTTAATSVTPLGI